MDLSIDRREIYELVASIHGIDLTMGDKMLINRFISEYNPSPSAFSDIWEILETHLIRFNHDKESKHLKELDENHGKWLGNFAEYIYQVFKTK